MDWNKIEYMRQFILSKFQKSSGVYILICKMNGKCYVGSSNNVYVRVEKHFKDLIFARHEIYELQKDFNEYGIENFEAVQLADCNIELRKCIEGYFIKKYDCINKGYNNNNSGVTVSIHDDNYDCIYEEPKIIKNEIDLLKIKCNEVLNDNFEEAQVIGLNNLLEDYRLMLTDCLSFDGIINLIIELEFNVYIRNYDIQFYYKTNGYALKSLLNGSFFLCNQLLALEYEDLKPVSISSVYIECPGFKNIECYQKRIELNNEKIKKQITELEVSTKRYKEEYLELTREMNMMYYMQSENSNYQDLLKLRKSCYLRLLETEKNIRLLQDKLLCDRSKNGNMHEFLYASIFKSMNKIIELK